MDSSSCAGVLLDVGVLVDGGGGRCYASPEGIPRALRLCKALGLEFDLMQTSFFLGHEKLVPSVKSQMAQWRGKLFVAMSRNALSATDFFKIPPNRVVELGTQVQL